jgi:hypothetical protein
MSTVRRADGNARSGAGAAVDTAAVLGVQQVRTTFLDDVRRTSRIEARDAAARHARRHHAGAHGSKARRSRGVGRSSRNRSRESDAHRPASLTGTRHMPPHSSFLSFSFDTDDDDEDDDPEDEDEEVEEDEEDDGDEEVWQVRLT